MMSTKRFSNKKYEDDAAEEEYKRHLGEQPRMFSLQEYRNGNKSMAVNFLDWFVSNPNDEVDNALAELKPDDLTEKLYDLWLERYFLPDTIYISNQKE